jgi:hypothetical protein
VSFWLGAPGDVTVEVASLDGNDRVTKEVRAHAGVNRWFWDLRWDPTTEQVAQFERQMEQLRERFGGDLPSFFADREPQGARAGVGTYVVRVTAGGETSRATLVVRPDPGVEGALPSVR